MLRQLFGALLLMFTLVASGEAGVQRYVATVHQSQWQATSSPIHCSLSHEIPNYGKAIFERPAGGSLAFRLEVKRQPRAVGVARLLSSAPAWDHERRPRDLGQVNYVAASQPFKLNEVQARRLLLELERGLFPTFSYQDWADGRDQVEVSLSAVNVRRPLGAFLNCLSSQLPRGFDDYRQSIIPFGFDSSALKGEAKQRLNELAGYMKADSTVTGIALCGHTDNKGSRRYNEALARRRAAAVRDYLNNLGVTADRYTIRSTVCGERNPLASNRSTQGRAGNRVVKVTLIK